MLEKIQQQIHQGVIELFVVTAVDELSGEGASYLLNINKIAQIADILDIPT